MIKSVVIASGLLVFAGATVASERATVAETNGFKACLAAAERDAKYLRVDDTYYINHGEESRTYYLNGVGRTPETAGRLRIACETDASGRRVTDLAVQEGRFVPRFANNEVASN